MRFEMSFSWRKMNGRRPWLLFIVVGEAPQKAHNENRQLPRNFILFTCFVYLLFFFSLFSFSLFLFSLFFIFFASLWGGDRPHRLPSDPPLIKVEVIIQI